MTEREKLLRKIQTGKFVQWELHIFLDTHPNDSEAMRKLEAQRRSNEKLVEEYERKFGPLSHPQSHNERFSWIASPWPWENGEVEE